MTFDPQHMPKVLQLYLEISQYPILARRIRQRMREELFSRGVVRKADFDQEVKDKAVLSQRREGLLNPFVEEPSDIWQARVDQIRDYLTDFYFAYNLPHDLFKQIVEEVLSDRVPSQEVVLTFNPELAPWELLFAQGHAYEEYPPDKRAQIEHHLREIIVVLIKAMISDQLAFVRVARQYFTVKDLDNIRRHRIGRGKIGGKAAGMLLAYKVLQHFSAEHGLAIEQHVRIPESWYLGSDVFYDFHANNDLFPFMNQKYKRPEQMRDDYPKSYHAYLSGRLPDDVVTQLAELLHTVGREPLIVRSSSLLEDNFDRSFAGKYDSFFLPNQGSHEENLAELMQAILRIYASVVRPDALIYRDKMGLIDYDERMAILIQKVEGRRYGRYYFPDFAGVGFSYNPYRWSKRIRGEDGLLRMVVGLGTRAVERVAGDYPRMVALSHPLLRPEFGAQMQHQYSQRQIDVIDLEANAFTTLPLTSVIDVNYPGLSAIASVDRDGYIRPLAGRPVGLEPSQLVVTFDSLLSQEPYIRLMRTMLDILQRAYERPVDIEFAGEVIATYPRPQVRLALLQCRPLSHRIPVEDVHIPDDIPEKDILFSAAQQVPQGCVEDIRYIVYVDPHAYAGIGEPHLRIEIGQVVGRINHALEGERFILMGPGRWGTSNLQLGVRVSYVDIYNTKVLIEIAHSRDGGTPELSYGTHFFQDLVEANIYPLPVFPDDPAVIYREEFFSGAPNLLAALLPDDARYEPYVKVIDVGAVSGGRALSLIMDAEDEKAVAFLSRRPRCDG